MMNHGGALTIYFINGGRSFIDWTKYMNYSTLHLRYIKNCVWTTKTKWINLFFFTIWMLITVRTRRKTTHATNVNLATRLSTMWCVYTTFALSNSKARFSLILKACTLMHTKHKHIYRLHTQSNAQTLRKIENVHSLKHNLTQNIMAQNIKLNSFAGFDFDT